MSEASGSQISQAIYDLSIFLHTELSSLPPSDIDDSLQEPTLNDLLNQTPSEALDYIAGEVRNLVEFRRGVGNFKAVEEYAGIQKYEKALQKLESEVRHHVKVEQQLRLHIEAVQSKATEEMDQKNDTISHYRQVIEQLKSSKDKRTHVADRSESPSVERSTTDRSPTIQELVQLRSSQKQESDRVVGLNRTVMKLEHQVHKYKVAYFARDQECRELQLKLEQLRTPRVPVQEQHEPRYRRPRKEPTVVERSTSRDPERAFTPVPSTLTTSRIPSQRLLHSHSTERKRVKTKTPVRKQDPDSKTSSRRG